jgi:hypothetical protein
MRTTLTIDDDIAAEIERVRRERDVSLKDVINDALRRGLNDLSTRPKPGEPFRTKAVSLGQMRLANVDNANESLAVAEGEAFK